MTEKQSDEFRRRLERKLERDAVGRKELEPRREVRRAYTKEARTVNSFSAWMKDKSVVFIGPAEYYTEPPELYYDVVVRVNHGFESGRRTDVLYVNNYFLKTPEHIIRMAEAVEHRNITWVVAKHSALLKTAERGNTELQKMCCFALREYFMRKITLKMNMCNAGGMTGLNMGLLAIEHLLSTPLRKLAIRGIDCYETGYYRNYSPHYPITDEESIYELAHKSNHNQDMHKRYYNRFILPDGRVDIDDTLARVLRGDDDCDSL